MSKYRLDLQISNFGVVRYWGESLSELREDLMKDLEWDYVIPLNFKLKSKFELDGDQLEIKVFCGEHELFDPFDELE